MSGTDSGRIFLSYRREDTQHVAGRLFDRLAERFGAANVFMDVDSIEPGLDFHEAIERAVGGCDVLLALIGKMWLRSTDEHGQCRLNNPDDLVLVEIKSALDRNIRVIPVLVDGATAPRGNDLPEILVPLARRNAVRLDHETFRTDIGLLIDVLDRAVRATSPSSARVAANDPPEQHIRAKAGSATEKHTSQHTRWEPNETRSKADKRTVLSWFSELARQRYLDQPWGKVDKQDELAAQIGRDISRSDHWSLGWLTRRQMLLIASSALVSIALVVVLVAINTRPWTDNSGPAADNTSAATNNSSSTIATDRVSSTFAYVFQGPSLTTPKVRLLTRNTKVSIQCITQINRGFWYRIDEGYIQTGDIYTSRDQTALSPC